MLDDMQDQIRTLLARTLYVLSAVARVLMWAMGLVFFALSISYTWGWPIARGAIAFLILLGFFLDFSKRELGGYRSLMDLKNLKRLTIDTKFLGLEVVSSTAINIAVVAFDLVRSAK